MAVINNISKDDLREILKELREGEGKNYSENQLLHAATEIAMRRSTPEYSRMMFEMKHEMHAMDAEKKAASDKLRRENEIAKLSRGIQLYDDDYKRLNKKAREEADAMVRTGRLSYSKRTEWERDRADELATEERRKRATDKVISDELRSAFGRVTTKEETEE